MHPLGRYTNLDNNDAYYVESFVVGFDANAMNNLVKNNLVSGRLPENDTEVVTNSNNFDKIGDTLVQKLENGDMKQYTVVGIIQGYFNNIIEANQVITLFDRNELKENDIVNITVLSKDVSRIYRDYFDIYYSLKSHRNEEGVSTLENNVQYNEPLLELENVLEDTSDFQKDMNTVKGVFIGIIVICSSIFLYSMINISIIERRKYFGILKSIGTTTKQMRRSIRAELFILLLITIPLGVIIGIGFTFLLISVVNHLLPDLATSYSSVLAIFEMNEQVQFGIPLNGIITSILIVVFTVYIATAFPIKKVSWYSTINLMRNNKDTVKLRKKTKQKHKENRWSIETKLAMKNIERYKARYLAVILSLTISIMLIIVSSYYVKNVVSSNYTTDYNYAISLQYEVEKYGDLAEKIIDDIQEAKIAKKVISDSEQGGYSMLVHRDNISEEEKEAGHAMYGEEYALYPHFDVLFTTEEYNYNDILDTYYINMPILLLNEDAYLAYLQEVGVDRLEENECILVDYVHEKTKYYDGIRLTNYNEGNEIILRNGMPGTSDLESLMENTDTLTIKKITDKIPNNLSFLENGPIIVGTEETIRYLNGESGAINRNDIEMQVIYLEVTDINATNQFVEGIKEKYQLNDYDTIDLNNEDNKNSVRSGEDTSQEDMDKTLLLVNIFIYSFIGIITLIGILNMYNAINTNLEIRKREVVGLITVGMEQKQINKMLWRENILCGLLALVLGIAFGLLASYIVYLTNVDYLWYPFEIPWGALIISGIGIIGVMLLATIYLKKKIFTDNLMETLRKE